MNLIDFIKTFHLEDQSMCLENIDENRRGKRVNGRYFIQNQYDEWRVVTLKTTDEGALVISATKKQLTKEYAIEWNVYIGNSCIHKYIDGEEEEDIIINDYNVPAYQEMLENDGYMRKIFNKEEENADN